MAGWVYDFVDLVVPFISQRLDMQFQRLSPKAG
jgi:hypothetical protein